MASCTMCGATLKSSSRFCSSCGALVKLASRPDVTVPAAVRVDKDHVDPLASTAPASLSPLRKPRLSEPLAETVVSPKAETGFAVAPRDTPVAAPAAPLPASTPKARAKGRGQTALLASTGRAPQPPAPAGGHGAGPVPPWPGAEGGAGVRVLVQWANGQKYPGVIEQTVGLQYLVRFETGERRWIESRYVLPA